MTEHLLGILASMLRSLPADLAPRIRLLAKFVEKDYEKIERLVKIRREYASRVSIADKRSKDDHARLSAAEQEDQADEWLSRRLDAGLFALQVGGPSSLIRLSQFDPDIDGGCDTCVACRRRRRCEEEDTGHLGRPRRVIQRNQGYFAR